MVLSVPVRDSVVTVPGGAVQVAKGLEKVATSVHWTSTESIVLTLYKLGSAGFHVIVVNVVPGSVVRGVVATCGTPPEIESQWYD
jgi:hypothetical protein